MGRQVEVGEVEEVESGGRKAEEVEGAEERVEGEGGRVKGECGEEEVGGEGGVAIDELGDGAGEGFLLISLEDGREGLAMDCGERWSERLERSHEHRRGAPKGLSVYIVFLFFANKPLVVYYLFLLMNNCAYKSWKIACIFP